MTFGEQIMHLERMICVQPKFPEIEMNPAALDVKSIKINNDHYHVR
jgi:hypothetical protein